MEHKEFLGENTDCIRALAERLVSDIPMNAQLMAFNDSVEPKVIQYLAKKFPDLSAHLSNLADNFVDLLQPFEKTLYFHPKQKGKNSIKYVMPALCPHMENAYHELDGVHDGSEAMFAFPELMRLKETDEQSYQEKRKEMLAYCKLDTLSMVEVLKVLREAVR